MHRVINLRCEYLVNPIGIDIEKPRLYWQNDSNGYNFIQSAYQILAFNKNRNEPVWDSGKVESEQSIHIPFECEVSSRERIYWKVRTWDSNDNPCEYSELAYFEMGLLKGSDWKAKWINPEEITDQVGYNPVSYIRKEFNVTSEIISARVYITACGMYEASINGIKAGDEVLSPGCTDYDYHIQYQTYDVTENLLVGENVISILLADGWYRGNIGIDQKRFVYGEKKLLLCQLEIDTTDEKIIVCSDNTFRASNNGPITKADFFHGEWIDSRKNLGSFDLPEYDDSSWHTVTEVDYGYSRLCASNSVPTREKEQFKPKLITTPNKEKVLDFGQNFTGFLGFILKGKENHSIHIYFGEALDENGNFTQANVIPVGTGKENPIFQQTHYTFSSNDYEEYKAKFYVHGFRYVKVDNWLDSFNSDDFSAYAVYSDMEKVGEFRCSNKKVNKLFENIKWSMKSNFVDIPTDCPTRERQGWNGDAQIFVNTANKLYRAQPFFRKWLKDYFVTQEDDGRLNNITPKCKKELRGFLNGCAGWGDAGVIIPYRLYQAYGDKRMLSEYYEGMKNWVEYVGKKAKKTNIFAHGDLSLAKKLKYSKLIKYDWNTGFQWGEWCEPGSEAGAKSFTQNILKGFTGEVATAYYYYSSSLLSEIADLLCYKEDSTKYRDLADKVKEAYIAFYTDDGKIVNTKKQANYVRPLFMEILPEDKRQQAADELNALIEKNDYKIGTGFLSTGFILKVLSKYGYIETAYKMLLQEDIPGWLYCVNNGATTIWERWDGVNGKGEVRASLNHYSLGEVADWFFSGICGISNPKDGYKQFVIKTEVSRQLDFAEAKYESIYGTIESSWKWVGDKIEHAIIIPANTTAEIIFNSSNITMMQGSEKADIKNRKMLVGSGKYIIREAFGLKGK